MNMEPNDSKNDDIHVTQPPLILLRKGFQPQLEELPPSHTPRKMELHQLRRGQMYNIHVRKMGACCANLCMSPPSFK